MDCVSTSTFTFSTPPMALTTRSMLALHPAQRISFDFKFKLVFISDSLHSADRNCDSICLRFSWRAVCETAPCLASPAGGVGRPFQKDEMLQKRFLTIWALCRNKPTRRRGGCEPCLPRGVSPGDWTAWIEADRARRTARTRTHPTR